MKRILCILLLVCMLTSIGCAASGKADAPASPPDQETATYAVLVGTTSEAYVDEHYKNAVKLPFDSVNDAVLALLSGKADYVVSAYTNCLNFVRANPGKLAILPGNLTNDDCSIAVNKSETELLSGINRVLERFRTDGTLERIIGNWIHDDGSDYVREEIPVRTDGPVLSVAVSAEREPMCFVENGEIVGLDPELIQRIAYELGMRVAFSDMKFSAMIPSVLSGKTPVAISNMSATDERRESVDFSTEYFQNPQVLLTRAELVPAAESAGYTKLSDLSGKRIGIRTGTVFDALTAEHLPQSERLYYSSNADLALALTQGKIDGFMADEPVARLMLSQNPSLSMLPERIRNEDYAFTFSKTAEGERLCGEMNAYLAKCRTDGSLVACSEKWLDGTASDKVMADASAVKGTNGTLRMVSDFGNEPFTYVQDNGYVGYEMELLTGFCAEYGYGLQISVADFGAIIPGLVSGAYDVAAACITITEERAESVAFSDPIYNGGVRMIVPAQDGAAKGAAIPPETARIGAVTGTTCEALANERYPQADYASFTGVADMMLALKSGKLDYCVAAEIDAINYKRNDQGYAILPGVLKESSCSIAVRTGNEALVGQLNALLDQYEADGLLARLHENWIRPDGSAYVTDPIPVHAEGPVLRVAVCSGTEPTCFVMNGEMAGLDVELMQRLAFDLGYRLTFLDMDFSALIAALESGRADVAIANMAATKERAEKVDFTRSYYDEPLVLVSYESSEKAEDSFFASLSGSFRKNFIVESRWKMLLSGVGITLLLSVCSGLAGIVVGFVFCLLRMRKRKVLHATASAITRILQGTPMVVLLMILYYVVFNKSGLDGISVSIIAFGLNFGAYASEIMLSGINAVDNGQREAAAAIGFTPAQTFRKIVFPQAARHFLPVLKGEYISLVKMTSIVGYVAVQDLTKVSDIIRSRTYEAFFPLIVTAIIYFLLSFGLSSLLRFVEIRIDPKHRPRTLKGVELQ